MTYSFLNNALRLAVAKLPVANTLANVVTSYVARSLSGAIFVSGLDADDYFNRSIAPQKGLSLVRKGITYSISPKDCSVTASLFGQAPRTGDCRSLSGPSAAVGETVIDPSPAIGFVFARADGLAAGCLEESKAVVVLKDGIVIGEHYGAGYGPGTPIIGYSLCKALCNAVAGILVRDGLMSLDETDLFPRWSAPGDARSRIRVRDLLQMTSGLANRETHSGLDPVSRMLFLEPDMADFAVNRPLRARPGSSMSYTCGDTILLCKLMASRLGGREEFWRRLEADLLAPLGMAGTSIDFDAAGTPILSTFGYAPARSWARLGQLYADGGRREGRQLLPPDWVAWSTAPGIGGSYGAGFRSNADNRGNRRYCLPGLPEDAFYAHGHLGQYIVVVPRRGLVVARLGASHTRSQPGMAALVREILAAASS